MNWIDRLLATIGATALTLGVSANAEAPAEQTVADTATPGSGWTLVWSDEFDGDRIDPEKWSHEVDCWGGGNEERQCYTNRLENSAVSDGFLIITARKEWMQGSALPKHLRNTPEDHEKMMVQPFSSAKLVTICGV